MPNLDARIKKARGYLEHAKTVCVLTGAGISAESGLKTFRDAGGLWENHSVESVATPEGFAKDPKKVWKFYNERRKAADVATPNAAHIALSRLEKSMKRHSKAHPAGTNGNGNGNGNGDNPHVHAIEPLTILTQNIDGLHQQAGSLNVIELHGSIWRTRCTACGDITNDHPLELPILPHCEPCGKVLRPDVVWFGEELDSDVFDQAEAVVEACDLFLVIGTSALVQPAASFPMMAAQLGVPVIEINKETTALTEMAEIHLEGNAGDIVPKLI